MPAGRIPAVFVARSVVDRWNQKRNEAQGRVASLMGNDEFRAGMLDDRMGAAGLHAHPRCRALPKQFFVQSQRGLVQPAKAIIRKDVHDAHAIDQAALAGRVSVNASHSNGTNWTRMNTSTVAAIIPVDPYHARPMNFAGKTQSMKISPIRS